MGRSRDVVAGRDRLTASTGWTYHRPNLVIKCNVISRCRQVAVSLQRHPQLNQASYRIGSTYGATANAPFCPEPSPTDCGDQFTAMMISKLVFALGDCTNLEKWNAYPPAS